MLQKYLGDLPQYLHFPGLELYNKLPWYLSLPPRGRGIKLFTVAIYCHSMVISKLI